jgi:lysophospholipase L1-like esterase
VKPDSPEARDAAPEPAIEATSPRSRAVLGYLALAAPALAIAIDSGVALARGWTTESRFDQLGMAAVAVWLIGVSLAMVLPAGRRFYSRRCAQLIVLAFSVCAAWLVAELALAPVVARFEPFHTRRPGLVQIYRPQPGTMRDVGPQARAAFNSWGVRGDDPPPREAAYRILCLGGSSTACTYLDDSKTWPELLENKLNAAARISQNPREYWVGNAGYQGFRTAEHRQFVEQSPIVEELDCIVVQAGVNDFMWCLGGPRPAPPLWTYSRVWQLARSLARRSIESGTQIEDAAATVYPRRRAVRQAAAIDTDTPNLDACLDQFAENTRGIIDACRRRNVRVVFTTQPVLWRADLDRENAALLWFGQMSDGRFLSVDQLRGGIDRYNATLKRVCREQGVGIVDLDALSGDPTVFYDDCHFTETGAALVAQLVADWLAAHPTGALQKPQS